MPMSMLSILSFCLFCECCDFDCVIVCARLSAICTLVVPATEPVRRASCFNCHAWRDVRCFITLDGVIVYDDDSVASCG